MTTSAHRCAARVVALLAAALLVVGSTERAFAQAAPNITLARVRFNSLRNTVNPQGELKDAVDALDRELGAALRAGRTGEARRLLAKGTALLNGRAWGELDEFGASLVLRSDRVFIDPATPTTVRLEQIFAPSLVLPEPLVVQARLRPLLSQPAGGVEVYELGRFTNVSRDLRDAPLLMDLAFTAATDGPYVLDAQVSRGDEVIATAGLRVWLQRGLDARLQALRAAAPAVVESVRADVLYPADMLRKINRGLVETGNFDITAELAAAEAVVAAAKGGSDPFKGRTGDFERHYTFDAAGEILPYRLFVPEQYDGSRALPLVVALHGLGGNEDAFFDTYGGAVPKLAAARGYLVVAPLGYRVDGFYGSNVAAGADPAVARARDLSERDTMEVLRRVRREYKVDETRIYLLGHSMGAIGAWYLAAKYSDVWAGVAPFSGTGTPETVARMRQIPQFVVHGDADPTVNVNGSRTMVAEMKRLNLDVTYIEVPGGDHSSIVVPNLTGAFDFFDRKRKRDATPPRR